MIAITLLLVVGLPVTSFAVSGNPVFITDPISGSQAKVNGSGQLNVTGAVTASPAPPSSTFSTTVDSLNGCKEIISAMPSGKAVVVTSVQFLLIANSTSTSNQTEVYPSTTGCTGTLGPKIAEHRAPVSSNYNVNLGPGGIAIQNGHKLIGKFILGGGNGETIIVTGYFVPASACSTGCY